MTQQDARLEFVDAESEQALAMSGAWTLPAAAVLASRIAELARSRRTAQKLDASGIAAIDTSGALLVVRALHAAGLPLEALDHSGLRAADLSLIKLVAPRLDAPVPVAEQHGSFSQLLERIGIGVTGVWQQGRELLGFVGLTLVTLSGVLTGKKRLRLTPIVFHMEQTGLDAVPIVALLTFLVGAVIAFLGATVLADFGAAIFTVELVSYSFLREFGVLLTAIMLAGRSGSAFTAQIGSMKSREELDAIQTLGLDAIELLVLPRLIALMIMLPLLTFLAMLSGIIGGGIVGSMALDITPGMFITRLHEMTELRHFWVGMIKAPVFAFLIAVVGCLEGFKVEGSAESVGRHTTSSVVQSIFLVILFDALFAIWFREMNF